MKSFSILTKLLALASFIATSVSAAGDAAKVPPEKELKALALDSMLALNQALKSKDFTAFHGQVSQVWQKQITPAKLREAFQSSIEQEVDLAGIRDIDPVFAKTPAVDSDGVLTLEGEYPTRPSKVDFRLKYISEKGTWKLFGVKINIAAAAEGKLPSEEEAQKLTLDSLGQFNRALQKKDFTAFHGQIAQLWQRQVTPEKLQSAFESFIEKEVDLTPVLKLRPVFAPDPAINDDGILELIGTFRTKPDAIRFHLGYIYEASAWKLVKINVNVGKDDDDED